MKRKNDNGPYNIFAETELKVEFFHCDPANIVWHGNYFNYFETARRILLEKIGYNYIDMIKSGYVFPIVSTSIKFIDSLQYNDKFSVKAILEEYENCLKIKFEIKNIKTDLITTEGVTTHMAYNNETKESCFVCPQILVDKVEAIINGNKQ